MAMILAGDVEPEQVGAMLVIMRYRKETPEELAGFVRAARENFNDFARLTCDVDWPSYADRHKQLPYFILAAKLLTMVGLRVAMHGLEGEGTGTTPAVLAALGVTPAANAEAMEEALSHHGLAYLAIENFAPAVSQLFTLRPRLGVRTAVNTFTRALNPLDAPCQMIGVFHPAYCETHLETARLLGQPVTAVFKGGGGEAQRNPEKSCHVMTGERGETIETRWPAMIEGARYPWREEPLEANAVAALWRGENDAPAPIAAVTGTAAIVLKLTGRASTIEQAQSMAEELWRDRPI